MVKFEEAKGEMGEKDFESEAMFERNIRWVRLHKLYKIVPDESN